MNNKSKNRIKNYFGFHFLIEDKALLALLLFALSVGGSFIIQTCCGPSKNDIAGVKEELDSIKQQLSQRDLDSLLILYGGGTVKDYLESKGVKKSSNRIIIPAPSKIACNSLGDDIFVKDLHANIVIMCSMIAEYEDFMMTNGATSDTEPRISIILEISLGKEDTLYLRTDKEDLINESYIHDGRRGIFADELNSILNRADNDTLFSSIYLPSKNSGTWNEYQKLTRGMIDSIPSKNLKEYTSRTDFIEDSDYIILTRSNYDPLKEHNTPIYYILEKNM